MRVNRLWGEKRFLKIFPGARYFQKTGFAVTAVPEVRSWGRARQDGKPAKEKEKYPAWGCRLLEYYQAPGKVYRLRDCKIAFFC